jgi:hypothetical protein
MHAFYLAAMANGVNGTHTERAGSNRVEHTPLAAALDSPIFPAHQRGEQENQDHVEKNKYPLHTIRSLLRPGDELQPDTIHIPELITEPDARRPTRAVLFGVNVDEGIDGDRLGAIDAEAAPGDVHAGAGVRQVDRVSLDRDEDRAWDWRTVELPAVAEQLVEGPGVAGDASDNHVTHVLSVAQDSELI